MRATDATIRPALALAGAIAPYETVALSNALAEPTSTVAVKEGDHVVAGQLLAQLNVDDLIAQRNAALATARADRSRTAEAAYNAQLAFSQAPNQVKQAQAQLVQAQATFREAQTNRDRIEELYHEGYLPTLSLDEQQVVVRNDEQAVLQASAALQVALTTQRVTGNPSSGLQAATLDAARQDAAAQYATAEQIANEIARAHIVSPVNGIVINRNLNPGEYPSGRQIFTIEANDVVFAILTASSVQAYQVHEGDAVTISSPGLPRARYTGTVAALLDSATPGSTNFTVKVEIPNPARELRAGTPVRAVVALAPVSGVVVPSSAFVDDARLRILVVRNERAHTVRVTEIATDGANSVVSGITAGASVVRDGTQMLTDGERVAAAR